MKRISPFGKKIFTGSLAGLFIFMTLVGLLYQAIPLNDPKAPYLRGVAATTFANDHNWQTPLGDPGVNPLYNCVAYNDLHELINPILSATYSSSAAITQADNQLAARLRNLASGKYVAINTANDLYNFSVASSFNWTYGGSLTRNRQPFIETIKVIMGLDYVLNNDIDYSEMKSKQFVPIGINVTIPYESGNVTYDIPFSGTFNGNGYTISNLYLADYNYITTVFSLTGDADSDIEFPIVPYYAMFAQTGTQSLICNLNLVNPVLEVLDTHEDISKAANLVGYNQGLIYNVSVVDAKKRTDGSDNSGIRMVVQSGVQMSGEITASGFVHTNAATGRIYNSYMVAKYIVSPNYRERFTMQPFVCHNSGQIVNSVYDSSEYDSQNGAVTAVSGVTAYTTDALKSGTGIVLNNTLGAVYHQKDKLRPIWYYYTFDCYPSLRGLTYNASGYFEIQHEYDFMNMYFMISKITQSYSKFYNYHTYQLMQDINMDNLSVVTPSITFYGTLRGSSLPSSNLSANKYIKNLKVTKPYITLSDYYFGMFSNLSGTVSDINFVNSRVTVDGITSHYVKTGYVGLITGRLDGTITRILHQGVVDLGNNPMTKITVGSLVGLGNGNISQVSTSGSIMGGNHDFSGIAASNAEFVLGGIVGVANNLKLHDSINAVNVSGITGTTLTTSTHVLQYIGGFVGKISNQTTNSGNSLYYLTNYGVMSSSSLVLSGANQFRQYLGGIFGVCLGYGLQTTELILSETKIKNGSWESIGNINIPNASFSTRDLIYAAGIGVSENSVKSEYYYMVNKSTFTFTGATFTQAIHNVYFFYASTIVDNSSSGIILSRAYNATSYFFDRTYFGNHGVNADIAPFFTSITDMGCDLRFCENGGKITVGNENSSVNFYTRVRVAGITLATKVNYYNVYRTGDIVVTDLSSPSAVRSGADIYVAGIAWIIPYINGICYSATNCQTDGTIFVSDISTMTRVSNSTASQQNFQRTVDANNIYIAGMFNINNGNILNSMNNTNITSTLNASSKDIDNTSNTIVGGIVTFNYKLIKDCANSGNIEITNSLASSETTIMFANESSTTNYYAGICFQYNGGVVLGGIAASIGDQNATILTGYKTTGVTYVAEVKDTSNNGNIFGKASKYVRSGGILGVALGVEICAGTSTSTSTGTTGLFASNNSSPTNPVSSSVLSNGLNFGNIYAITETICTYSTAAGTASAQRIGISSCAGGVIGYGLCVMTRMLNHGNVYATDVAGGIVGATYILGASSTLVTSVNINTAVHYGKVFALKYDKYSTMVSDEFIQSQPISTATSGLYQPDSWVFTNGDNNYPIQMRPCAKRGFGGIFGRLQRGYMGQMNGTTGTGTNRRSTFVNVMNCDTGVDFIGRLDQTDATTSLSASYDYFRFCTDSLVENDYFYTARQNDTTQAVFSGATTYSGTMATYYNVPVQVVIRYQGNSYSLTSVSLLAGSSGVIAGDYYSAGRRTVGGITPGTNEYNRMSVTSSGAPKSTVAYSDHPYTGTINRAALDRWFTGWTGYNLPTNPSNNTSWTITSVERLEVVETMINTTTTTKVFPLNKITEDPSQADEMVKWIYDPSFPLMSAENSEYIYYSTNDSLADRFRESTSSGYRQYGMYVLASSEGKTAGAVLPSNLRIDGLYRLNEPSISTGDFIDCINPDDLQLKHLTPTDELMVRYKQMFQVRYNELSSLLTDSNDTTLADLTLYDPAGKLPTLSGGVINQVNKTVTFTVSYLGFNMDLTSNYVSANYQVLSALVSSNAAVAKVGITNDQFSAYNTEYLARDENVVRGNYAAIISGNLGTVPAQGYRNQITGNITVYSELASQVGGLMNNSYYTEYTVIINLTNTNNFSMIRLASSQTVTITNYNPNANREFDFTTNNSVSSYVNKVVTCTFRNTASSLPALPVGHTMKVHSVAIGGSNGTIIDPKYYSIEYQAVATTANNRDFGFTITFSDELRANTSYAISFTYYDNGVVYKVLFGRTASSEQTMIENNYDTYSNDASGNNTVFAPVSANFTSYIQFGINLGGIVTAQSNIGLTVVANTVTAIHSYLYDDTSYTLRYNLIDVATVKFKPGIVLQSATITCSYDANNYRQYAIRYDLTRADNSSVNYTQTIRERDLNPLTVYRGNIIEIDPNDIIITREARETLFYLNFNFPDVSYYQNVRLTIGGQVYLPGHVDADYEMSCSNFYELLLTYNLEPGSKSYDFRLRRENGLDFVLEGVRITKLYGADAYLKDINFQTDGGTAAYPNINPADNVGNIITNIDGEIYDPRVYFAGIDYDSLDEEKSYRYFRIDGTVSNIDLELYSPDFTLPAGAMIERYDEASGTWTNQLASTFISMSDEDAVVLYRITSEDGYSVVYYYITATDIIYNLTIRFQIYYRDATGVIHDLTKSPLGQSSVLITTKNYSLSSIPTNADSTNAYLGSLRYPGVGAMGGFINGIKTQSSQFYYPVPNGLSYLYTFGRGLSGYYGFSLVTPQYQGATTDYLVKGQRYLYSIYLLTGTSYAQTGLDGVQSMVGGEDIIRDVSLGNLDDSGNYDGKYFYIEDSTKNRIRVFAIVIESTTAGGNWGLYDYITSWDK